MHEGRLHDNGGKRIAINVGHPRHSGDQIREDTYNAFYNNIIMILYKYKPLRENVD